MKAPKVLMAGTNPAGRGGIATVVTVLQQNGFFARVGAQYIVTHTDGSRWQKLRGALGAFWQLLRACLSNRPAIVHVHAASHASFFRKSLILATARLFGCATVFHLHAGSFGKFATEEAGSMTRRWIRHTLEASSSVVVLSQSWARFMAEFAPAAKVHVIANPVRVPAIVDTARELPGRILFLGRIGQAKGIFDLLEAVAQLRRELPEVRLAIGGDGEEMEALRQAIQAKGLEQNVECLGWIGADERDVELAKAQVFCLPSYVEGLPMSMLEAMAAGKAVVVTPIGGIPEAIRDRENGILVQPGDIAALAAALKDVLIDKELRARIAHRARDTVVATYGTEVVMDKLARMYEEIK